MIGVTGARAQTSVGPKKVKVKIYLLDVARGLKPELLALTRPVNAELPRQVALEAQVAQTRRSFRRLCARRLSI